MRSLWVKQAWGLKGEIVLSGDKSIAHRCIIISAISLGKTTIENFPASIDCSYTIRAFKKLGIKIISSPKTITVYGAGLYGLKKPRAPIFVGDSGTTLRLLLGVLAGQNFEVTLKAGKSLSKRPMLRVTMPLRLMGAKISGRRRIEEYPPLTIRGGNLKPITYKMPVASAQVKSAILLAGLYTKGITQVLEPLKTRDHTERMLKLFKADIKLQQNKILIKGNRELVSPKRIYIPADISSASFFIVLASILPNSQILIKDVSLNPSRLGIIKVLRRMGADIQVSRCQGVKVSGFEPKGDIMVKSSKLKGAIVKRQEIPSLIDELPILMVAACNARGKTIFEGVEELRVKETDRIRAMSSNLSKMGGIIKVVKVSNRENIIIKGVKELRGKRVRSFGDHRTAMSMVVAGLRAKGSTLIDDITCINKSFPGFTHLIHTLKFF